MYRLPACTYVTFFLFELLGSTLGTTTRMQLLRKSYCTPNIKMLGSDGNFAKCGISDVSGTEGLTLPGMENGVHVTKEDIILVDDGMAKVTVLPNRPYKYLLSANSDHYRKHAEIFGGVATTSSEGVLDFNNNSESKGGSFRFLSSLTEHGFTETGHTVLDGIPVRVLTGYATDIKGAESLDNFAKGGLAANAFTFYMDEKVDGKVVKMEARNSYAENELLEEVFVTAHQTLSENMNINDAFDELQHVYGGTACKSSAESLQSQFAKAAANENRASPSNLHERHLSEDERLVYKAHEGRWDDLDWLKVNEGHRSLRRRASTDGFQPIDYFTIKPNSAAEAFFKHESDRRKLIVINVMAPKGCDLEQKTFDDIFCVHASLNTTAERNIIDVAASIYDYHTPNTSRISAGINLIQVNSEAIDLHISGGGTAVVYSTDGEVRLEATANLQILDGGNPRRFPDQQPSIGCGYVLSGEVSLKADKTDLLTAGFGGVGVVGGGKDSLLGNYLPLSGGLDALVAGFVVEALLFARSNGNILNYIVDLPVAYGIWAPFYKHTGLIRIFDNKEVNLLEDL
ncbi:hypothetical protein FOL47_009871 [Perkinsus chesapeaki]|uniref:Uncharacterized protein n=1 Tax=Perkinsus chesapeaki TaxID=330153 RepID=A0A7J6L5Y7_PERCH|nr:hypothetical protein FOL47_009871 [Perkinsus chesapeaki]